MSTELVAHSHGLDLAGSLWLPERPAVARRLLARGVAVASFDKRGVGGSGDTWLEAGIGEQADDLLAGVAAARAATPGVPVGVLGHSPGGWVVLEALRRAALTELAFAVTSSGPAASRCCPAAAIACPGPGARRSSTATPTSSWTSSSARPADTEARRAAPD